MNNVTTAQEKAARLHRRAEAFACNAIEGQPPTEEDISMFEMFDRKGMSHDERRDHINAQAKNAEATLAAEWITKSATATSTNILIAMFCETSPRFRYSESRRSDARC